MIYLFDNKENLIFVIPRKKISQNLQVWMANGLITGTCSVKYAEAYKEATYFGTKDVDDESLFWMYKIDKVTKEDKTMTFQGTHVFFDDLKDYGFIKDIRPKNKQAGDVANQILDGTRWSIGNNTATHVNTNSYYYTNRLSVWWDFVKTWDIEFKPRITFINGKIVERRIDIADRFYRDYGKVYRYGSNLVKVVAESTNSKIKTAFVGRGNGSFDESKKKILFDDLEWSTANGDPVDKPLGQDYVELPEATAMYGYSDGTPRIGIVDINTDDKEVLLQKTYEHLMANARPLVQFKADVIDTSASEQFETVGIVRDDIGIRYKTRVFKVKRDFLNPKIRTIEFGDKIVTTYAERQADATNSVEKIKENTNTLNLRFIESIYNDKAYNYQLENGNEYGLPSGYYSFDKPIDEEPTKVIYIGAGKLAIANSKNADGSWDFRTFINGDRVLADTLQTDNVTIDGSGITVDNGALNINDIYGKTIITSQGLKAIYQYQSTGNFSDYQVIGWSGMGGVRSKKNGSFRVEVPNDFIIEKALLNIVICPAVRNATTIYPKSLRLKKIDGFKQILSYPTYGEPALVSLPNSDYEDLTEEVLGGLWNPESDEPITITKEVNLTNHLEIGSNYFELETSTNSTPSNLNIGLVRFYITMTGYLKGGADE